jgi:hypothetical protein
MIDQVKEMMAGIEAMANLETAEKLVLKSA